eukprot:TRINITY_DN11311_c0_g1_i1.p2 TRINITY_DN11311_c0_g1~~TRINITY_DN11311_c0_g1_i1.p2  ORF type:complete len:293 (-),score=73.74 TRINITY_DN11311_c0_g1_i1:1361-2239(-)
MDEPEYEGGRFSYHLVAGSAAGVMEHLVMFPVDTIKTHMQAARRADAPLLRGMMGAARHIVKGDAWGLFRGLTAMAFGAAPAHGVYFATYEVAKEAFGGNKEGHQPVATAAAGALATSISDFAQTPLDVIKQRLQLESSRYNRSVLTAARTIYQQEGLAAFWLSYPTTLVMNIPYHAVQFATYESAKKMLTASLGENNEFAVSFAAGAIAGGCAAALTTPLDVAKTRLQTQSEHGRQYHGMLQTLKLIAEQEGAIALMRGLVPRVLFAAPSGAICWVTYEWVKSFMVRSFGE